MDMKILSLLALFFTLALSATASAKPKVASVNSLLTDLAKQIGGDKIEVINLIGSKGDPHTFNPTTKDLQRAQGAKLYLASGKNLEAYLPKLKALVGNSATVLEVGKNIRSLRIKGGSKLYACCPNHSTGVMDPHWWHSIEAWRKASTTLATEFSKIDPANKAYYAERSKQYRAKLANLKAWSNVQLATIPKERRKLATSHAAFGYFCKEFGFQSIPLKGINSEHAVSPQYLNTAIGVLKEKKVRAIFPDESSNSKALKTISKNSGVPLARKLYADSHTSIERMFIHNVTQITKALGVKK